jgi:glucosamine--fructose-6-phosphate aminotransferase (isomerizing)
MTSVGPGDDRQFHHVHALDDIRGQPEAVERAIEAVFASGAPIVASIARARRVFFAGAETSRDAAHAGAWMLRAFSRGKIDAHGLTAFEFAFYAVGLRPDDLLLALTGRGHEVDVDAAIDRARRAGMETVVLGDRDTSGPVSHALRVPAPLTRSAIWTSLLAAVAALGNDLADPEERLDLRPLPDAIRESLDCEPIAHRLAATLVAAMRDGVTGSILIVAGGPNGLTARHAAVDFARLPSVMAASMAVEDAMRDLPAWVDENSLLLLLAPPGVAAERAAQVATHAGSLGVVPVALVTDDTVDAFPDCHRVMLPSGVPEHLTPITTLPPLQLLAYYLSIGLGSNPDLLK